MNDKSEALLDELINKHNFIVKVSTDPDDNLCVMVDFAGRKQAYYRVITDEEGEVYGIGYSSSLMTDDVGEEFIPISKPSIRTYIVCDILRQCRWLNLSYDIIRYYLSSGEKCEFTQLLEVPMDEYERSTEKLLEGCMSGIINGNFDLDKMNEVLEEKGLLQNMNLLRSTLL